MATQLKHFFDRPLLVRLAGEITRVWPEFPLPKFMRLASENIEQLELLERARLISDALSASLPPSFPDAVKILIRSLGPELDSDHDVLGLGMGAFFYMPHVIFVAQHGKEHFVEAMEAQYELTKRFSAEFSIRVFLQNEPERTLNVLSKWTRDKNSHVRRLVSEGTRSRLPWAMRLKDFQTDPTRVLELLEKLKDDPAEYVRRSVANNLNDIGKDHPKLLTKVCQRWMNEVLSGEATLKGRREKLIRHALRSAIKRGDKDAFSVLGFKSQATWSVVESVTPSSIKLGEDFELTIHISHCSKKKEHAVIDAAIHFVKANGTTRPRVFKLKSVSVAAGETRTIRKNISLRAMSTRQHYAGSHKVETLINGDIYGGLSFKVYK